MGYISNILLSGLLLFPSSKNQAQNISNSTEYIYGQWKYEKHLWSGLGRYTLAQVNSIKKSILHIERDKIFFDKIKFIDTCNFSSSKITTSNLFDRKNEEYTWFEEGDKRLLPIKYTGLLPSVYTKEQLSKINLIDLGCVSELSILYLKQDTLILNYVAGVIFFLTKVPDKYYYYTGTGKTTKELSLNGNETTLKLSYEFFKDPDQLVIEDQSGKELFKTERLATKGINLTSVKLSGVTKLIFKVKSEQPNSLWRIKVELQYKEYDKTRSHGLKSKVD